MPRSTLLALWLMALLIPTSAKGQSLDELSWILGTWQRQTSRSHEALETWQRAGERTFEGGAYAVAADGERRTLESLLLVEMAGELFYIAKVPENEVPVPFRLVEHGPDRAVFENPQHDFPQRITYQLLESGKLLVVAELVAPEDGQRLEFRFERRSE